MCGMRVTNHIGNYFLDEGRERMPLRAGQRCVLLQRGQWPLDLYASRGKTLHRGVAQIGKQVRQRDAGAIGSSYHVTHFGYGTLYIGLHGCHAQCVYGVVRDRSKSGQKR